MPKIKNSGIGCFSLWCGEHTYFDNYGNKIKIPPYIDPKIKNTGGTVIPNHDLGGLGGSTNIVVNVDASGSNVEGDEEQGRQLGELISAAIQSELIKQKRPGGMLA